VERLSPRYRAIALDLHGYGDNSLPSPGPSFTLDDEVRLVAKRLDELAVSSEPLHLVGHSYGALVAMRFAQLNPGRIVSLSLYEPVAFRVLADDEPALQEVMRMATEVAGLVAARRTQDAAQAFVDFWNGDGYFTSLPFAARHALARRVAKVPLDFQASMRWPMRPSDFNVSVPVLLLVGADSPEVTRRVGARLAEGRGEFRVHSCPAGHMGPLTNASIVNPWIEAFISAHEDKSRVPATAATAVFTRCETNETRSAGVDTVLPARGATMVAHASQAVNDDFCADEVPRPWEARTRTHHVVMERRHDNPSDRPWRHSFTRSARMARALAVGDALARLFLGLRTAVRRAYARYRENRAGKVAFDALRQLNHHTLRDIGLYRD